MSGHGGEGWGSTRAAAPLGLSLPDVHQQVLLALNRPGAPTNSASSKILALLELGSRMGLSGGVFPVSPRFSVPCPGPSRFVSLPALRRAQSSFQHSGNCLHRGSSGQECEVKGRKPKLLVVLCKPHSDLKSSKFKSTRNKLLLPAQCPSSSFCLLCC